MTLASNQKLALVVRHFPGDGRLSGLVSFSREIAALLKKKSDLEVFSGDVSPVTEMCARKVVPRPFWLHVWPMVRRSKAAKAIILSGIHSPRWAIPQAIGIRLLRIPKDNCLFIQAVGLDSPWSSLEMRFLAGAANVSALNPIDYANLRSTISEAVQLTPGVSLGVETSSLRPLGQGLLRIGFLGHLNEVKGADRLPEIFDSLDPKMIQPVIAGVGKFENLINDWAAQSEHSVETHGYLDDPVELLKSIDILVAPFRKSATVLGLSQVVLEAVAMGIPVVGTPVEAISGVVRNEVEGLIAESNSEISLALKKLISDREKINELSKAAIERGSNFSIEQVVSQMLIKIDDSIQN